MLKLLHSDQGTTQLETSQTTGFVPSVESGKGLSSRAGSCLGVVLFRRDTRIGNCHD